jgi:hypothetical protein
MNNQNMQKYCCILENENGVERVFYNDKTASPPFLKMSIIYNLLCERLEVLEDKLIEFGESMLDSKYGDLCKYLTSDNVRFIKIINNKNTGLITMERVPRRTLLSFDFDEVFTDLGDLPDLYVGVLSNICTVYQAYDDINKRNVKYIHSNQLYRRFYNKSLGYIDLNDDTKDSINKINDKITSSFKSEMSELNELIHLISDSGYPSEYPSEEIEKKALQYIINKNKNLRVIELEQF